MRIALISYHKNVFKNYPKKWIDKHVKTVTGQTFMDFDIYEVDYGGDGNRIFDNSFYDSKKFPTFVHTMNYLLDHLFNDLKYDVVGNLNVDDYYDVRRLELQLPWIKAGYHLVSSNYSLVRNDTVTHRMNFEKRNVLNELLRGNNVVAHPSMLYSKHFWKQKMQYDPDEIPTEDMQLWIRALEAGFMIKIVPEYLLYYRIHANSVCNNVNSR